MGFSKVSSLTTTNNEDIYNPSGIYKLSKGEATLKFMD